jgi:hypothetical protein
MTEGRGARGEGRGARGEERDASRSEVRGSKFEGSRFECYAREAQGSTANREAGW